MGTWGFEPEQDDFVCDIMAEFEQQLKQNQDVKKASQVVIENYRDALDDADDGPLFWIALAIMQWKFGKVDDKVLEQIKNDFNQNAGLERWLEIGEEGFTKRKQIIADLIEKVSTQNPKPKKLPKIVVRKPIYQAGDCLSITLENGLFGAALVLVADHSDIEDGRNLIGVLNYMENTEADLSVFTNREWLLLNSATRKNQPCIHWYGVRGHRTIKPHLKRVGHITGKPEDPQESNITSDWNVLRNRIMNQRD